MFTILNDQKHLRRIRLYRWSIKRSAVNLQKQRDSTSPFKMILHPEWVPMELL